MSTVGLSFGSPTGGQGFDVSATVSSIVANLQNVETPWKNELTKLESQDTVISSMGTLVSNLSTDLSTLTEADGVLSEKTGGSSNDNVVTLTSASSSAVAGTHTVVVNSLAVTSTGYLPELADSSTTLSGSITLQVGSSGSSVTINLDASDGDTLSDLATQINNSGAGITANVETDSNGSWLSLVSGTSGASGDIIISANSLVADTSNTLGYTGSAGTSTTASTGTLATVSSTSASLSGSLTIQVGSGTAQPIDLTSQGGMTVSQLADYINTNLTGVTASVVTNSEGSSSLQLTSSATGSDNSLTVTSSVTDPATAMAYTTAADGADANLTVDGKTNIMSSSNVVSGLIPGVTMELLSTSTSAVTVTIGNYNSGVESAIYQFVTDYNSLVSAISTQEGNDSSGNAEPLFGSPTLSLLQQQILSGLNLANPNGYLTPVSADDNTILSGSMTIQVGSGSAINVVIGTGSAANTIYTGSGSDYNTLQGLEDALNAAAQPTYVDFMANSDSTSGTLTTTTDGTLEGTLSFTDASGNVETIYLGPSSDAPAGDFATGNSTDTLSSLATYIQDNSSALGLTATIVDNGDGTSTLTLPVPSGVTVSSDLSVPGILAATAGITTNDGESTLTLNSLTSGSAITIKSQMTATSDTPLNFSTTSGSTTASATAKITAADANDTLSGSMTVQVGSGTVETISMSQVQSLEGGTTLSDIAAYINDSSNSSLGISAAITNNGSATVLTLTSGTPGTSGNLTMTSSLLDTTDTSTASMSYTSSSDISTLSGLGLSVNTDGSLSLNVTSLDSTLNSDFSGVAGFFQNFDSWGQNFSTILSNSGTSSTSGLLALASKSNSSIESTLNADISREESLISAQQKSLTAELNSANEILQEIPSQLSEVNMLYSAITGYNQSSS